MAPSQILVITQTPSDRCRRCGAGLNFASCMTGPSVPGPGDVTLCFDCGEPYRFTDDLHVEPLELEELEPWFREKVRRLQTRLRSRRQ